MKSDLELWVVLARAYEAVRRHAVADIARHELTPGEFGVLEALVLADGAVVSAEDLLDQVWDENLDPFSNVVQVTIGRLRRKLGTPPLIETVVGTGYRL